MSDELSMQEWERQVASVEEDARVTEAMILDMRENAEFLRGRGHPVPAEALDKAADEAQAIIDEGRARLEEA